MAANELAIPAISLRTALQPLARDGEGALKVPDNYHEAGWWSEGPLPGDAGAVIVAGHVDSADGPGVFWDLPAVRAGDLIHISDSEGNAFEYTAVAVRRYLKRAFPTARVYPKTDAHVLRLITCGGPFDREAGSYRDNIVVYAVMTRAPSYYIRVVN